MIGVTVGVEIGVDLEQFPARSNLAEMAEICFTPGERSALVEEDPVECRRIFARLWTRKEAVLKACGVGITSGLQRLDVSEGVAGPDENRPIQVAFEGKCWDVWDFSPAPGYAAAVALDARSA